MFLIRLIHLSGSKKKDKIIEKKNLTDLISTSVDLNFKKEKTID